MGIYTYEDKKIVYGFRQDDRDRLINVKDINIGESAVCVICGNRIHSCEDESGARYFSHDGVCINNKNESYEHIVTKYLVRDAKRITVPELNLSHIHDGYFKYAGMEKFKIHGPCTINFDEIRIEQNIIIGDKTRRADLVGYVNSIHGRRKFLIEVTAYHKVELQKIREYALTNCDVIEVEVNMDNVEDYTCRYMASITSDTVLQFLFSMCSHKAIHGEGWVVCDNCGVSGANVEDDCMNCQKQVYVEKGRFVQCYNSDKAIDKFAHKFSWDEDTPKRTLAFKENLKSPDSFVKMLCNSMIGNYTSDRSAEQAECDADEFITIGVSDSLEERRSLLEMQEQLDSIKKEYEKYKAKTKEAIDKKVKEIDRLKVARCKNEKDLTKLKEALVKKKEELSEIKKKNTELNDKMRAIRNIVSTRKNLSQEGE